MRSLQRFAGKAVSFSLAVPAAKLYCREVNFHIGKGLRKSKAVVVSKNLKKELEHWKFLDTWDGFCLGDQRVTIRLKLKNIGRIIVGYVNINSISKEFEALKEILGQDIDILMIAETNIDPSFPK